ncbi:hypothetical protein Bca4012_026087 [Brassica carinata]|uniref:Uncharacterized protein n=1 Tax=Brassica carinata TaxID=52824 RepID=A0A8X7VI35_BRACI|nr:hypothetical protein Bca52824_023184 [Brassica carinata]
MSHQRLPSPEYHTSPPYITNRASRKTTSNTLRRSSNGLLKPPTNHQEKTPAAPTTTAEDCKVNSHPPRDQNAMLPPRPLLERNLNMSDFPPPPHIPTMHQVIDDLRKASYQYANHPDPTESEARRVRILESEARGKLEDAAARIIANVTEATSTVSSAQQLICFHPEPGFRNPPEQKISFASENDERTLESRRVSNEKSRRGLQSQNDDITQQRSTGS